MATGYNRALPTRVSGEEYLFQRIIAVQIADALGNPIGAAPYERDDAIYTARRWLCFGPDLLLCADFAGPHFDGDKIRWWAIRQRDDGWSTAKAHPMLDGELFI